MPKEDILVEGDYVNELFVIVTGEVQVTTRPWHISFLHATPNQGSIKHSEPSTVVYNLLHVAHLS